MRLHKIDREKFQRISQILWLVEGVNTKVRSLGDKSVYALFKYFFI